MRSHGSNRERAARFAAPALLAVLAVLAGTGCGKYGPPEWPDGSAPAATRSVEPPSAPAPVPTPADEEREAER